MKGFISFMDKLPLWAKIVLAIPMLDIIWALYRIVKGLNTNNVLMLVFGILWIFPGSVICWIVDLVSVILCKKPVVFA